MSDLSLGAIKSAVAAGTGVILGLPMLDAEHFNFTHWQGALRILAFVGWMILVGEARFWNQWANRTNGGPHV